MNSSDSQIVHTGAQGLIQLEVADRRHKVWDLYMRGVSKPATAKALDISVATVYNDLKMLGEEYRNEILKADPLALVAENVHWLDEMERIALYEIQTASRKIQKIVDKATGVVTEIEVADPNKSKFFSAAIKARELKLKLFLDTGIIPKDNPEKMFKGLQEYEKHEAEIEQEERSPEEIRSSIEKLLRVGKTLQGHYEKKK